FLVLGVDVKRVQRDRFVVVLLDHSRAAGLASSGKRPSEFPDPACLGHDHSNLRVDGEVDDQRRAFRLAHPEAGGTCQEGLRLDYRHRAFHHRHYATILRYSRILVKRIRDRGVDRRGNPDSRRTAGAPSQQHEDGGEARGQSPYQNFLIEGETHAYLARERMRWIWSKPANLTVNGPVKFAIGSLTHC